MAPKPMAQKRKAASSQAPSTKKPKISKPAAKPKAKKPAAKQDKLALEASDSDSDPTQDQTAALLKGFESASDNEDDDDSASDASDDAAASKPLDLALLPDPAAAAVTAPASAPQSDPTVLYLSRVPHGFHEAQMQSYFGQFGALTHLRLARNRRTGRSRHFAFLQFADAGVARIVARTMDNYLLFGHVLKCRVVPWADVARMGGVERIFAGSGRRWKKVPWNAIERNRVQRVDRKGWAKRVKGEEKRRSGRAAKLKELGYEFVAPEVRHVEDVPVKINAVVEGGEETQALENGATDGDAAATVVETAGKNDPVAIARSSGAKKEAKKSSTQGAKKKKTQS